MEQQSSDVEHDQRIIRYAVIYASLIMASIPGIVISLYGQLFGPTWTWVFGAGAFVLALSIGVLSSQPAGLRFRQICPWGLSGQFTGLQTLKTPLKWATLGAAICAGIGIVCAIAAGSAGVTGAPVFAPQVGYFLTDHGKLTEVSRLRYLAAGTGFYCAWHGGAAYASMLALQGVVFGHIAGLRLQRRDSGSGAMSSKGNKHEN